MEGAVAVPGALLAAGPRRSTARPSRPAARCCIVTGAANRDQRAYDDPDRFDIDARRARSASRFGHGIHYCIGAHLARLEGRTAFTELYRRWPDLQVDLDGVEYVHMANVAGRRVRAGHRRARSKADGS